MWTCPTCGEKHEDQFEECWKCAGHRYSEQPAIPLRCLRCEIPLTPAGTRFFKLETGGALVSMLTDMTVVHQDFELFACERCGKVEFFLPDVGREHRQRPVEP